MQSFHRWFAMPWDHRSMLTDMMGARSNASVAPDPGEEQPEELPLTLGSEMRA